MGISHHTSLIAGRLFRSIHQRDEQSGHPINRGTRCHRSRRCLLHLGEEDSTPSNTIVNVKLRCLQTPAGHNCHRVQSADGRPPASPKTGMPRVGRDSLIAARTRSKGMTWPEADRERFQSYVQCLKGPQIRLFSSGFVWKLRKRKSRLSLNRNPQYKKTL